MGVLYSQELADRVQAWLSRPLTTGPEGKRSAEGLLELASLWAAIHRLPLPECIRQCQYSERHASVAAYLREFSRLQSPDAMSDTPSPSKYQFAPQFANETLVHEELSGPVTAANLTDETAEFFLKKGRKDLFVKRGAATEPTEPAEIAPAGNPDLTAEQNAHAVTKLALADEKEHGKATLKAEKEAHKATKKELAEVQKQLADAQKQLAKVAEQATHAAGEAGAATTDAEADASK